MNENNEKDITNLYEVLFQTIKDLRDGDIDIHQAKAINESAQVIINAGKLQIDYLKLQQKAESSFLEDKKAGLNGTLREIQQKNQETYDLSKK